MKELSFFEKVGFTREESMNFERICKEYNIDFNTQLKIVTTFKTAEDRQNELNRLLRK